MSIGQSNQHIGSTLPIFCNRIGEQLLPILPRVMFFQMSNHNLRSLLDIYRIPKIHSLNMSWCETHEYI